MQANNLKPLGLHQELLTKFNIIGIILGEDYLKKGVEVKIAFKAL